MSGAYALLAGRPAPIICSQDLLPKRETELHGRLEHREDRLREWPLSPVLEVYVVASDDLGHLEPTPLPLGRPSYATKHRETHRLSGVRRQTVLRPFVSDRAR
jgi:hypothetical protein